MRVILLGTAAGGGFPQWNCWCPTCRIARAEPARAVPRRQSSIAFSADGKRWFLGNASPDVREQLAILPIDVERIDGNRYVPIEGVLLTDAELDHTLGIALLREGRRLQVFATASVVNTIAEDSRILPVTQAFASVDVQTLALDTPTALRFRSGEDSGLTAELFAVRGDPPRFARRDQPGHTVGAIIRDRRTGGSMTFVPGCGAIDDALAARVRGSSLLLIDGTFWTDDELIALGIGDRPAIAMGHVPVTGPTGSLSRLPSLGARTAVYTHINNTNRMLVEDSEERRAVEGAGVVVGADGMAFEV